MFLVTEQLAREHQQRTEQHSEHLRLVRALRAQRRANRQVRVADRALAKAWRPASLASA
jgi:hypothetical protein